MRDFEEIKENVVIQKKVFVDKQEIDLEFICEDTYYIGLANQFAKIHDCDFFVDEK